MLIQLYGMDEYSILRLSYYSIENDRCTMGGFYGKANVGIY